MNRSRAWAALLVTLPLSVCVGCNSDAAVPQTVSSNDVSRPNILFIVGDTVRADRLSLYGHERKTTPFLDQWARDARVYDDCVSVGSTTVPSHASMFTGLMPTEHRTANEPGTHVLPEAFDTLAELLKAAGYGAYAFVANPYLAPDENGPSLMQGFDQIDYPWDQNHYADAVSITLSKIKPYDRSNILADRVRKRQQLSRHNIKACGELALPSLLKWLDARPSGEPFFAFLNYMETHAPLIPPEELRREFMTSEQTRKSYAVNRRFRTVWEYVFGLHEYTPEENELTAATYDAALLELDGIWRTLLETLVQRGYLDNTVVVIVGDHGEHLGEHHMLDHQFSVYEQLMRIPLIIHYPARFTPGRESRPVMNIDLFPTLLELVGLDSPVPTKGVNLLEPPQTRPRLGEYPVPMSYAIDRARQADPTLNVRPWKSSLRAYYDEPYKLIAGSDGRYELYNLVDDPGELNNLLDEAPEVSRRMQRALQQYVSSLRQYAAATDKPAGTVSEDTLHQLEALGYAETGRSGDDSSSEGDAADPASRPAVVPETP